MLMMYQVTFNESHHMVKIFMLGLCAALDHWMALLTASKKDRQTSTATHLQFTFTAMSFLPGKVENILPPTESHTEVPTAHFCQEM